MKKTILFLLILVLTISFCSCGPKTIEEAYETAKRKVETEELVNWNMESGEFRRKQNGLGGWKYIYEVNYYAKIDFPSLKNAKGQAYATVLQCNKIIGKEFKNFDVELRLSFYTRSGSYICWYRVIDGEILFD